jgi:hypothetical protein
MFCVLIKKLFCEIFWSGIKILIYCSVTSNPITICQLYLWQLLFSIFIFSSGNSAFSSIEWWDDSKLNTLIGKDMLQSICGLIWGTIPTGCTPCICCLSWHFGGMYCLCLLGDWIGWGAYWNDGVEESLSVV